MGLYDDFPIRSLRRNVLIECQGSSVLVAGFGFAG